MGKRLIKKFIKDHENVSDPDVRDSYGRLAGTVGIICNSVLSLLKIVTGILCSSIAIIADGINNLADASSSVITLIGFRLSSMPEDRKHPYGHARIEYITGLFISIIIIVVGVELLMSSVDKIMEHTRSTFSYSAAAVLVFSIVIKLWNALFSIRIGKKINSTALKAAGIDSRNDVISTLAVLAGLFASEFAGIAIDGYVGGLVSFFIIWSGVQLVKETSGPLLGEAPDEALITAIAEIVRKEEGVLGMHDLIVHNYGPGKIFASLHVEIDSEGDLMKSHDMIDNIERQVKEQLKIEFVIHMDPVKINDPLVNEMYMLLKKAFSPISGISDIHDLRVIPGPTHTNVIFDVVLAMDCEHSEETIKNVAYNALKAADSSYCPVITFEKAYTRI